MTLGNNHRSHPGQQIKDQHGANTAPQLAASALPENFHHNQVSGGAHEHKSPAQIRAVISTQIKARLEASTAPTPGAEVLNTGLGLSGISVL